VTQSSENAQVTLSTRTLTTEQLWLIQSNFEGFRRYLETDDGKETIDMIRQRTRVIGPLLAYDHVNKLTEDEFGIVMKNLWALNFWRNKNFKVGQLLKLNGLDAIRNGLRFLLHAPQPLEDGYERFKIGLKGFGQASITEILTTMFPDKYCVWNSKPINVLPFLQLDVLLPPSVFKGQMTGSDYVQCVEVMGLVKNELEKSAFKGVTASDVAKPDYWTVDLFMWYIFSEVLPKQKKESEHVTEAVPAEEWVISSHEESEAILLELGNLLGYDTYTSDRGKQFQSPILDKSGFLQECATLDDLPPFTLEKHLVSARLIDVIWLQDDLPQYCFEVEHSTNVKDGLLREYQLHKVTQSKLFIIAPEDQHQKFDAEVSKEPFFRISDRYVFNSYGELVNFYKLALQYEGAKSRFFGTGYSFRTIIRSKILPRNFSVTWPNVAELPH